jgi:hypothetical protein
VTFFENVPPPRNLRRLSQLARMCDCIRKTAISSQGGFDFFFFKRSTRGEPTNHPPRNLRQLNQLARMYDCITISSQGGFGFFFKVLATNRCGNNILDMEITYLIGNEHTIEKKTYLNWANARHSARSYGQ